MTATEKLRTWLVLARASNLPTVWSNCIAGCWLGGWAAGGTVLLLCVAASLFYAGGMFLNDFCDVSFDRQYKQDRPIIGGQVSRREVGFDAAVLMLAGLLLGLAIKSSDQFWWDIQSLIVTAYDFLHKRISWAPVLMAACRFFLYLTAAAAGALGLTPRALGFAFALGLYVVGLSYLARGESQATPTSMLSMLLLLAPVFAGFYFD